MNETQIDLTMCENCETMMSLKAIAWCDDERTFCDNCFNSAIAKAENAYDASMGR